MTENVLAKPFDEQLRLQAQREGITVKETVAPSRNAPLPDGDKVPHIIAVRPGEWVVARFPVGLPRKEGSQ